MIAYSIKTDEYLADLLDRVSRGAEYFLQIDVSAHRAKSVIEKWTQRYKLDQTARQRTYRLKSLPALDLIAVQTQAMQKADEIRLCLLVTLPLDQREKLDVKLAQSLVQSAFELSKSERESFFCVADRKNRLTYKSVSVDKTQKNAVFNVYELVQLPYSKVERKRSEIAKESAYTWRLHADFMKFKTDRISAAFKKAQKTRDIKKQDALVLSEMLSIKGLAGFRGVRDDVFKLNHSLYALSHKFLNRRLSVELEIPRYTRKTKRSVKSFDEMLGWSIG